MADAGDMGGDKALGVPGTATSQVPDRVASTGPPVAVCVMGVSGSGKSTLGQSLADALACPFLEGDSFHDAAAVEKMRTGHPLSDADRGPWLDRLGRAVAAATAEHGRVVFACSALKRAYRDRLAAAAGAPIRFVLMAASHDELLRRLETRPHHFMPASLLDSQLATLEPLAVDEPGLTLDATRPQEVLAKEAVAWLRSGA